jgi:hypothetical protein
MHRGWSFTLKIVAAALMVSTRDHPRLPMALAALAAVLGAVALDLLDWRRERKAPWPRLATGAIFLAMAAFFLVKAWQGPPVPAVEVPELGFRLRLPGPDWQLSSKDDLPSPPHAPDTQAGATSYEGVSGVVLVLPLEKMAGPDSAPDLDALARQHKATIDWKDRRELSYQTVTFAGHEARRYLISGTDGTGTMMLGQATLFVRGRRVYIIAVVGPRDRCGPDDPRFRAFTDAVELLPG